MDKELQNISLDGIPNINEVANFSLKLETLSQTVQRHKELRELCHKEFLRRMENVLSRRRCLLERRRIRQTVNNTKDQIDSFQGERNDTQVTEVSTIKLHNIVKESEERTQTEDLPDITKAHLVNDNQKRKGKTVGFEKNQDTRVHHNNSRGKRRNSKGNSSDGNKFSRKSRRNFRRISLAVGGAVRISARRRNTYPTETGLFVGKSANNYPKGKMNESKTESQCNSFSDEHRNTTPHSNRGETHLAITRQTLNTNARVKIRDIVTRVKVIKTFQGSIRKGDTKTDPVKFQGQK